MRRLRKLTWDGHKLLIRYDEARAGDWDTYELLCGQAPLPSLLEALKALASSVAKICQLEAKYCTEAFEVRGVSISFTDADIMGATITALKHVTTARAPLVLNTPHLMAEPQSPTDEAPLLPSETMAAIGVLEDEAWRYVKGERAQGDLFAGEAGKALGEAVANMAPEPGSGIEEVTISSGDRSVTLRQGDMKPILAKLAQVAADQKAGVKELARFKGAKKKGRGKK